MAIRAMVMVMVIVVGRLNHEPTHNYKVIINTVYPRFNDFIIHLAFICRRRLQFDSIQYNLGRQSSTMRYRGSYRLGRTGYSHYK